MNYCTHCGAELTASAKFCANCGEQIMPNETTLEQSTQPVETPETTVPLEAAEPTVNQTERTTKKPPSQFMERVKRELTLKPSQDSQLTALDEKTGKTLHIISWVCFALGLFTFLEIIMTVIGYYLARTAILCGVNANVARWINLILTVIYAIIFIVFFFIGFFEGMTQPI